MDSVVLLRIICSLSSHVTPSTDLRSVSPEQQSDTRTSTLQTVILHLDMLFLCHIYLWTKGRGGKEKEDVKVVRYTEQKYKQHLFSLPFFMS